MEVGYKLLSRKSIFKIKKDVNSNIVRFKECWKVHGYFQQFGVDFN